MAYVEAALKSTHRYDSLQHGATHLVDGDQPYDGPEVWTICGRSLGQPDDITFVADHGLMCQNCVRIENARAQPTELPRPF